MFGVDRLQAKRSAAIEEHRDQTRARLAEALAPDEGAFVPQAPEPVLDLREAPRRERPLRAPRPVTTEV